MIKMVTSDAIVEIVVLVVTVDCRSAARRSLLVEISSFPLLTHNLHQFTGNGCVLLYIT
jgi:hypothetical protein